MSQRNIFETPEGDKLTDDFWEALQNLAVEMGMPPIETLMLVAKTDGGVAIVSMGCVCTSCKKMIFQAMVRSYGADLAASTMPGGPSDHKVH